MKMHWQILIAAAVLAAAPPAPANPAVIQSEFVYDSAPFPECHASTLAQRDGVLFCAWFGGTEEKNNDVCIWLSRNAGSGWSAVEKVADGVQSPEKRFPCWNPVLFQPHGKAPLLLFYKVGPSPSQWWGMVRQSEDGKTWSAPRRLPDGILGPIKNKPAQLADGTILCGSSTEDNGWRVHFEWTKDLGQTWEKCAPINDGKSTGAIQPALLAGPGRGEITALCRNRSGKKILSATAPQPPAKWPALEPIDLPNPNSGIDAVTLTDGRHVLVYNHTASGRSPLNVAVSSDLKSWQAAAVLENDPGEYSYPAVIQTADGRVHVSFTWKRKKIRHVVLDAAKLRGPEISEGKWPASAEK
jgi:predicted neuraminidase